jgi:hypothetical protein
MTVHAGFGGVMLGIGLCAYIIPVQWGRVGGLGMAFYDFMTFNRVGQSCFET